MACTLFCTLKKRSEFIKISKLGERFYGDHLMVQALPNSQLSSIFRVGYVVTRKTGNAVKRNKAKRRLRAMVYASRKLFATQCDYVFIARDSLWSVKFEILQRDFCNVLKKMAKSSVFFSKDISKRDDTVVSIDN